MRSAFETNVIRTLLMNSLDKNKALRILDLDENFTREKLIQSFRKKLFAIHPDTASDVHSEISVDDLIASREYLEEFLENKKVPPGSSAGSRDDGYSVYREGMRILSAALSDYWKNRLHYSHRPEEAEFIKKFHKELNRARENFISVLNQYPGGLWTPDAVEEIARINNWLGFENDAG